MIGIVGLMKQAQPTDFSLFPVSGLEVIHWRQWVAGKHTIVRQLAARSGSRIFSKADVQQQLALPIEARHDWHGASCFKVIHGAELERIRRC